jgi:IS4 transposase
MYVVIYNITIVLTTHFINLMNVESWYLDVEVTFELLCFVLRVGVPHVHVYWMSWGVYITPQDLIFEAVPRFLKQFLSQTNTIIINFVLVSLCILRLKV